MTEAELRALMTQFGTRFDGYVDDAIAVLGVGQDYAVKVQETESTRWLHIYRRSDWMSFSVQQVCPVTWPHREMKDAGILFGPDRFPPLLYPRV